MREGRIKGFRTDCVTGVKREVELGFRIWVQKEGSFTGQSVFTLIGGPTGYEGFYIKEKNIEEYRSAKDDVCWIACFGTKNRWDKLEVPVSEMRKALGIEK